MKGSITTLFVDIGGVLLTNGWDHDSRRLASKRFKLDWAEMESRHHLTFDTFEIGKLTLKEYLNRVVFFEKRMFTHADFREFMFAQSKPFPEMLTLVADLKTRHGLKVAVVSNEGRELNDYRIRTFGLAKIADFFVSSCIVGLRKPDKGMFRLALDLAQARPERVAYIENTAMFAQVAEGMGIRSILHADCESTRAQLAAWGLR